MNDGHFCICISVYIMLAPVSICVLTFVCSAHVHMCGKRLMTGVFLIALFCLLQQGLSLVGLVWLANIFWEFFLYFLFSGYRQASRFTQLLSAF